MKSTTKISDVFIAITALYHDLNFFNTEPKTTGRYNQNLRVSLNLIKYFHKKASCKELLPIILLQIYEMDIVTIIATGKILKDETWRDIFSNAVKEIQSILLSKIPIESKEYQTLLKEIPGIAKYTPQTEPTYT